MIDIKKLNLLDILPQNLCNDPTITAVAQSLDAELQQVALEANLVLLLARLDDLPEKIVDELAWQYHVDFYDYELPIEQKRNLIRQSYLWHRKKGTPWAVKQVVSTILEGAEITENWEYGGQPYRFKVNLIKGSIPTTKELENLYKAVKATKNTRSWLDGVNFFRSIPQNIYYGIATDVHKDIEIYPFRANMPDIKSNRYYGCATSIFKEVIINNG